MKTKLPLFKTAACGFTLIELLTVISIIGVLAAMIIPAVARAKIKAQSARTAVEISQLVGAIKQYESTYSRFPISKSARDALLPGNPDYTFGTYVGDGSVNTLLDKKGRKLPPLGNKEQRQNLMRNNSEVMAILLDMERFGNGQPTVNVGHGLNPQRVKFLDVKEVTDTRSPGIGMDGVYRDPWGNPYIITMDVNFDNKCHDGVYRRAEVSQLSSTTGLNGLSLVKPENPGTDGSSDWFAANTTVMVWSLGPDGWAETTGSAAKANAGFNKDNVLS